MGASAPDQNRMSGNGRKSRLRPASLLGRAARLRDAGKASSNLDMTQRNGSNFSRAYETLGPMRRSHFGDGVVARRSMASPEVVLNNQHRDLIERLRTGEPDRDHQAGETKKNNWESVSIPCRAAGQAHRGNHKFTPHGHVMLLYCR
jgi:hypothetical protein